jgi:hypothetical protein
MPSLRDESTSTTGLGRWLSNRDNELSHCLQKRVIGSNIQLSGSLLQRQVSTQLSRASSRPRTDITTSVADSPNQALSSPRNITKASQFKITHQPRRVKRAYALGYNCSPSATGNFCIQSRPGVFSPIPVTNRATKGPSCLSAYPRQNLMLRTQ